MKSILTDTGYWIGLIDKKDQYYERASTISELIDNHILIFPWPCLYETLRTKYCKRADVLLILDQLVNNKNIVLFDDSQYRNEALKKTIINIRLNKSAYSLADNVIREIISDMNIKIDYFVTFNKRDFIDICKKRKLEIIEG